MKALVATSLLVFTFSTMAAVGTKADKDFFCRMADMALDGSGADAAVDMKKCVNTRLTVTTRYREGVADKRFVGRVPFNTPNGSTTQTCSFNYLGNGRNLEGVIWETYKCE